MSDSGHADELERALARPDAKTMIQQIDAYAGYHASGSGEWPDEYDADFHEIITCAWDNPEKALAYVVIAAARTDDAEFLRYLGCGPLEDALAEPSADLIERVVAEARRSAHFR